MNTRTPSPGELTALVKAERTGVEALVEVLQAERAALVGGDADRLGELSRRKRELLLHIAHLGDQRGRLLEHCGATPDRSGMERLLAANGGAGTCQMEWNALLEESRRAKLLNQENGDRIDSGMRANQQALSTLTSAARSQSTYSAAGRTTNAFGSRSLASA